MSQQVFKYLIIVRDLPIIQRRKKRTRDTDFFSASSVLTKHTNTILPHLLKAGKLLAEHLPFSDAKESILPIILPLQLLHIVLGRQ